MERWWTMEQTQVRRLPRSGRYEDARRQIARNASWTTSSAVAASPRTRRARV